MNPVFMQGGCHADVRGTLRYCNGFAMSAVKRFYTIANSAERPIRGWIGHKKERKWFFPLRGRTEILVKSFNAEEQRDGETVTFVLDATKPGVLDVPPRHWFCIKQDGDSEVMVFSNCAVGEFEGDDLRRPL